MTKMILHNANVVTMDPQNPRASLVAIENGRISFVGSERDGFGFPTGDHRVQHVDCQGNTVVPAFHDAHIHLGGLATFLISVDCSPASAGSIQEIQSLISKQAKRTPPGQWIRARGYHEMNLAERQHPTRYDLDLCAPLHPVKLTHQSGHGSVLNSAGLALLGINEQTRDLPGGVIQRVTGSNIPNGLLLEMENWLSAHIPGVATDDWMKGIGQAKDVLISRGVTSFQDATAANTLSHWRSFLGLVNDVGPKLRATFMLGIGSVSEVPGSGGHFGGKLFPRLGHGKVMVTATSGAIHPELPDLSRVLSESQEHGAPLAIHAVEIESIAAALEAWRDGALSASFFSPHRFEHCPESPDWVIRKLKHLGINVVVNPGFIYYNGDRYLETIPEDRQSDLYPFRSMGQAQLTIAAGSDSPVVPVDPIKSMYSAVFRKTAGGGVLNPLQSVSIAKALNMHTTAAAEVTGVGDILGSLTPGKYADLVVLSSDPWSIKEHEWESLGVVMTILDGEIVWGGF